MRQIILTFIGVVLSCSLSISARKPCVFSLKLDSNKSFNGSKVTSGGSVYFLMMGKQNNCLIDLDSVYDNVRQHTLEEMSERKSDEKEEIFKEFDFYCFEKMAIHFVTNDTNTIVKLKISVGLLFGKCDIYLEELSLFLKYGTIWSIVQDNGTVIHAPSLSISCPFAEHVRIIGAEIYCYVDALTSFFWESCIDIFEKVKRLYLTACKTNHFSIKSETLVKSFPKLQSLHLKNVDLLTQMTFPWTQSYVDATDQDLVRFLSNETKTNMTVTSMGRIIWIQGSKFEISEMLLLNGNIMQVVINNADIKQNESQMFKNVIGLFQVDLSGNNLKEINELLFDNQSDIQEIHLRDNKLTDLSPCVFEDQHKLLFLDLSNNMLSSIDSKLLKNQQYLQELHLENNRLQFLPQSFLKEQINNLKYLYLHSNPLKTLPVMPFYGTKIENIDIHKSNITGESIVELVTYLRFYDFYSAGAEWEASDPLRKAGDSPLKRRELNLSFCKIKDIPLDLNAKNETVMTLVWLFQSFYIKGDGNPFTCNCQLYKLQLLFETGMMMDWTCMYPQELKGKAVTSITEGDVYCPVNVTDCPTLCACYVRYDSSTLIIDCRNVNMSTLPLEMPKYPLELWFKNSSLSSLEPRDYFLYVSVLDLSENKLTYISPLAASELQNMTNVNLENNDLTSLPVQIKYANISRISLSGNAFLCDCHTRWMRVWLHDRMCPVTDWDVIKCTDNTKKVNKFINLPDSIFVCHDFEPPRIAEHVIFPSIVIGSILLVIMILSLTIYFQRFTVRVLLYMIFGVRICDGFIENQDDSKNDCVIIYDKNDSDFVENNIKKRLQESDYKVADMYKDSIIGFTFIEGITRLINKSKRVIFCMTKHSLDCELIKILWNIASERAMKNNFRSIILIVGREANCTEENMKLYIRNGRYIKMESKLLHKSIEYLMSQKKRLNQSQVVNNPGENVIGDNQTDEINLRENIGYATASNVQENAAERHRDIYIVYPDVVDELHTLTRYDIIPFLRENKQNVYVLQDDFVFGEDIRYSIESKLDQASHVIFIISNETLESDIRQYVLTTILTKAFAHSSNYLLVFSYGQIDVNNMTENLKKYVNNYITASVKDSNFKERMLEALMYEENTREQDEIESLVTEDDVDNVNLI